MNLTHFKIYSRQDLLSLTKPRKYETKLGENIQIINNDQPLEEAITQSTASYIVFGIPEDIGVQANLGTGGTSTAWLSFLQSFLNIQSNDFLSGDGVAVTGHFDFGDIQYVIENNAQSDDEKVAAYRHAVHTIDAEVESLVKVIVAAGKIPIAIGGGHNNAYPLIKGSAKGLSQLQKLPIPQINCINLDAHVDYRPAEGRHSGNAFRYAEEDGFLQKYCVIGVQENYLQQNVWIDLVNNPFIDCITFEDIFVHEKRSFYQAVSDAINFTSDTYCGIELDMDIIEKALCSAQSPSGISTIQARQYISLCAAQAKACYLHICEGATSLVNGKTDETTGKLIAFLVSDFIKGMSNE